MEEAKEAWAKTEKHHLIPVSYGGEDCKENIAEILSWDHRELHEVINDDAKQYKQYRRKQSILENWHAIVPKKAIEHMSNAQRRLLERTEWLPMWLQEMYQAKTYEISTKEVNKYNDLTWDNYTPEIGTTLENHEVYTRAKKEISKLFNSKIYW